MSKITNICYLTQEKPFYFENQQDNTKFAQ